MDKKARIDFTQLAATVKGCLASRKLTLRQAAKQTGVSPSTLSRIQRGQAQPDLDTVKALVDWAGVPIEKVLSSPHTIEEKPQRGHQSRPKAGHGEQALEVMEVHFRADPDLPPKAAEALITIMRAAYSQMAQNKNTKK